MTGAMVRHPRQTALREVGAVGQARIEAARAEVRLDGLAARVAVRYLAGAGVGCLCVRSEGLAALARTIDPNVRVEIDASLPTGDDEEPLGASDPFARELSRGAHGALRVLRVALGIGPTP